GEDDELRAESARLAHLDEIVREATAARQVIDGVDPAVVAAHLARAAERDPDLSDLRDRAERAAAEWSELAVDLAGYLTDLPADPGRADEVEQRRATLGDLRRHLQRTGAWPELVDDAATWGESARERLGELGDDAALISALEEQLDSQSVELAACAQALSHERRGAAERLAEAITAELAALAMPNARIDVRVLPREVGSGEFDVTVDGDL
ncbi:MAG: hypothetical protein VW082_12480, partial [Candidatus Nanopelagicales bacterium]